MKKASTLRHFVMPDNENPGQHIGLLGTQSDFGDDYTLVARTIFSAEDLERGTNFIISTLLENAEGGARVYDECNNAPECKNLVLLDNAEDLGKVEFLCEECHRAWKQSEFIKSASKDKYKEEAEAVYRNIMLPLDMVKEMFLNRPSFIPIYQALKPASTKRETLELAKFEDGTGVYLSNLSEPFFNMSVWSEPWYSSCQNWKDHRWADGFMKFMHQIEDPCVYMAWYGTPTGDGSIRTRALVRLVHDSKAKNKKMLAVDQIYGYDSDRLQAMLTALKAYATSLGRSLVKVDGTYSRFRHGICVTDKPAFFTSGRTSYNDIGDWIKSGKIDNDGLEGQFHVSGYTRL